jgi:prolyl oligopeptidase
VPGFCLPASRRHVRGAPQPGQYEKVRAEDTGHFYSYTYAEQQEYAMKARLVPLVAFILAACGGADPAEHEDSITSVSYPETPTVNHTDEYHGITVADPYRWLEDDVRENPDVRAWVEAQNAVTFEYLAGIPERATITERMTQLWDYERYGIPVKEGGRYFYSYNNGLQNQSVIYVQADLDAEPELLIDPNTWSEDGTIALASYHPSPDGRHVACLVQEGGSDWRIARVMAIEDRRFLDDELEWLKFTDLSWARDGSGFYYSRYPVTADDERFQSLNMNQSVWFHRLGTPQSEDRLVYARPDNPAWGFSAEVTDDGTFLVITTWIGTDERYQIVYRELDDAAAEAITLIEGFDFDYTFVGNVGRELHFRTNNDAPRNRLIAIDVDSPQPERWREVIPESADVLAGVSLVGGRIIADYMHDASTVVRLFTLDGADAGNVELPGIGTAVGFSGKLDDPETFFLFRSYNSPGTINRFDVDSGNVTVYRQPEVDFDSADYMVEQVFYSSRDGTQVPMFVTRHKDTPLDGTAPTLLYGYGGFNISLTPSFSISVLAWMEMGGIYAVANLRGGGEYGRQWHQAGTKLNKQNVFDDFISAAEFLIESNYTNRSKLAIYGRSNGGLLIGAVVNQRPELFGAALAAVGVMDMLRFHQFTAGRFWVDDYGSADDPEEFEALYAYSPYHNVASAAPYPPMLITTADTDDRVVPGHSFKYAAAMQAARTTGNQDNPVLIRIETDAGHGAGVPTDKVIQEYADMWAFLVRSLDMSLPADY